ncbi:MAG: sigma-70 family RNA polymerase sigma factor [Acidobacteria bacterium]|nr:sigma-70 family RNA polymerase sigma factor [Acidobacteriota bacterium]
MDTPPAGDVTTLLRDLTNGRREVLPALLPLIYAELRRVAAAHLRRERRDHTLQATALVHEAYLRLVDQRQVQWQNRAHFLAVAAQAMRRILVDHARARSAAKRGNAEVHMQIEDAHITVDGPSLDIVALDNALTRLAAHDARQVQVVELRFFGGLSVEEAAEVLGVSAATVKREWSFAKAWLRRELSEKD